MDTASKPRALGTRYALIKNSQSLFLSSRKSIDSIGNNRNKINWIRQFYVGFNHETISCFEPTSSTYYQCNQWNQLTQLIMNQWNQPTQLLMNQWNQPTQLAMSTETGAISRIQCSIQIILDKPSFWTHGYIGMYTMECLELVTTTAISISEHLALPTWSYENGTYEMEPMLFHPCTSITNQHTGNYYRSRAWRHQLISCNSTFALVEIPQLLYIKLYLIW